MQVVGGVLGYFEYESGWQSWCVWEPNDNQRIEYQLENLMESEFNVFI